MSDMSPSDRSYARTARAKLDAYLEFLRRPGRAGVKQVLREATDALIVAAGLEARSVGKTRLHARSAQVEIHIIRARVYEQIMERALACKDLLDALALCTDDGMEKWLLPLGRFFEELNDEKNAEQAYEKAEQAFTRKGKWKESAEAAGALGYLYTKLEQYVKALGAHQRALSVRTELRNPGLEALSYSALARTYAAMADGARSDDEVLRLASDYDDLCVKSVAICKEKGTFVPQVAEAFLNLAIARLSLGNNAEAHSYAGNAAFFYRRLKDRLGIARTELVLGTILRSERRYSEASVVLARAYRYADNRAGAWLLPHILLQAGLLHCAWRPLKDRALEVLLDAEHRADIQRNRRLLMRITQALASEYERRGRCDDALRCHRRYMELYTDLNNDRVRREMRELEAPFHREQMLRHARELRSAQTQVLHLEREQDAIAAQLIGQKNFLERLLKQVKVVEGLLESGATGVAKELGELKQKINEKKQSAAVWQEYYRRMKNVDPDFARKLKKKFPRLTKALVEVCALSVAGFTAKQIADARSVVEGTIDDQRKEARKIMGIKEPEVDLKIILERLIQGE